MAHGAGSMAGQRSPEAPPPPAAPLAPAVPAPQTTTLADHLRASGQNQRQTYSYKVPPKLAASTGIESVTLVELTADEEIAAAKRSRNDNVRLAYELVKSSLVGVNGKQVSLADGTADAAWNRMDPKVRALALQAYASLHNAEEEDVADFINSRSVNVG
jgi:hypothetical protein